MREIILKRIEEIRIKENGFPTSTTRWRNFLHGTENKHLKDIDFNMLDDTDLAFLFEKLIRRYYTQM